MPQVYTVRSRVNQPERVFASSNDDPTQSSLATYSSFRVTFDTPILDSKKVQLLRATIPNALQNIPNYSLVFWYHAGTSATFTPSDATLRCVRLYPTNWVGYSTTFTPNRFVSGGSDFVSLLNTAAGAGGDLITANPYWHAADVTFSWNSTTNQISWIGNGVDSATHYAAAGWADNFVRAAQQGLGSAVQGGQTGGVYMNTIGSTTQYTLQPYALGYTLNLRVGFTMSGLNTSPLLYPFQANAKLLYANNLNLVKATSAALTADSYPNLVYTGAYTVYSDIVSGCSLGSNKTHNLLAVIPNNAEQLGIAQYTAATLSWLTRLPDTIYAMNFTILDDASQPVPFPDSAVINLELAFHYREDKEIYNP